MLVGLISFKASLITLAGKVMGLSNAESVQTGFLLSQGGEFAFVVLSLAAKLNVLPEELNKILIMVVILSMFLTPSLESVGARVALLLGDGPEGEEGAGGAAEADAAAAAALPADCAVPVPDSAPVVVFGFGRLGQVVAEMVDSLPSMYRCAKQDSQVVVFDADPERVEAAQGLGYPVRLGNSPRDVAAAGISQPRLVVLEVEAPDGRPLDLLSLRYTVSALKEAYPDVAILAATENFALGLELREAGVTVLTDSGDPAIRLGADVLAGSFAVDAGSLERVRNGVAAAFSARRTQMRGPAAEGAGEAACTDTWRDDLFVYTGRDTRDGASIKLVGVREGEEDGTISADEIEGIKSRF